MYNENKERKKRNLNKLINRKDKIKLKMLKITINVNISNFPIRRLWG